MSPTIIEPTVHDELVSLRQTTNDQEVKRICRRAIRHLERLHKSISIDLRGVSGDCRQKVFDAVIEVLRYNSRQITEDLEYFSEGGEVTEQMMNWRQAANEQLRRVMIKKVDFRSYP